MSQNKHGGEMFMPRGWGWKGTSWGGWTGPWPGRGPFSYLPPWQRPGWLFGRGACWWLFGPYTWGMWGPWYGYARHWTYPWPSPWYWSPFMSPYTFPWYPRYW